MIPIRLFSFVLTPTRRLMATLKVRPLRRGDPPLPRRCEQAATAVRPRDRIGSKTMLHVPVGACDFAAALIDSSAHRFGHGRADLSPVVVLDSRSPTVLAHL